MIGQPRKLTTAELVELCQKHVTRIAEVTGQEWTFGYIGNCDHQHDDRAWYAFRRSPGHAGTSADRIGGMVTEDLDLLLPMLAGARRMAAMLTTNTNR